MGEITHHQDQSILSISFRTIKTMVNRPANPIPTELLLDELGIDIVGKITGFIFYPFSTTISELTDYR